MEKIEKFDYEKFDYDKCLQEIKANVKKPNIMICGNTGVGKSSLINDIFGHNVAEVGYSGKATTRGIHKYQGETINLFDTEGFEIGNEDYVRQMLQDKIEDKELVAANDFEKRIHEIWYCINGGSKRFLNFDREQIRAIRQNNIPVMIVITKIDTLSDDELNALKAEIKRVFPTIYSVFTYCSQSQYCADLKRAGLYKKYIQREEMIEWAIQNLDESLQAGLIPSLRKNVGLRRNYILKNIVAKYSGMAGAVVTGTSFVNVPFSDSVPLMALQVKMAMSIINAYGINADAAKLVGNVIGTTGVSYLGKTLASQLISVIPFIGNAVKATVNVGVATAVTASLGTAITLVCEQYLKACIRNNGAENLLFADFMTTANLTSALKYVSEHKSDFKIAGLKDNSGLN